LIRPSNVISEDDVDEFIEAPVLLPPRAIRGCGDRVRGCRRPIVVETPIINPDFRGFRVGNHGRGRCICFLKIQFQFLRL